MKEIKIDWCKNWIKHTFEKLPFENGGIYTGCFWDMAENPACGCAELMAVQ